MPYEVRVKAGESAFSVVVETAKQALAKVDELLEQADVDDVSVRDWSGKIMDLDALEADGGFELVTWTDTEAVEDEETALPASLHTLYPAVAPS